MTDPTYLTIPQLADRFQISKSGAYNLAQERRIPTIRIGGSVRIPVAELEIWEAQQKRPARN